MKTLELSASGKFSVREWWSSRSETFSRLAGFEITKGKVIAVNITAGLVATAAITADALPGVAMIAAGMAFGMVKLMRKGGRA
ncbi:MAG: hypothetical protein LUC88_04700 [Prevotella sp.]|nr:hypothetical protein [Prevotella sp.]